MKMLKVIGKTTDGKLVLSEVYKYYASVGLPLDSLFEGLRQRNAIPSWIHFYNDARQAGIKHSRILSMLDEPLTDVYGVEIKKFIIERIDYLYRSSIFRNSSYLGLNKSKMPASIV